ncbi:MAG: polysaccharide biosynthesis/export family protein [Bacteroidetes bacterium]|nr:polysaccharide biosynthesis/export family protein [Bacteroidota bacterium]MBL0015100.1 polysaccharide biosynthesis/export family protein [Bacteroidota bacterium]MBP6639519.1 polysaccharide biosynthesis/export family protein [Bacteroidia bacterium]MBP6721413.1 polysaccharide biosynthesis/export family protein [Bacteroidia bacterium]MBP8073617.1 polysaccharide biosynthesis/export family protein [Bacteroidia bacterium]
MRSQTASNFIIGLALGAALMLLPSSILKGQRLRNVLFNTPKAYEKLDIPVVHLNPDSVRIAAGYEHRIESDDQIGVRFLNNIDITKGLALIEGTSATGVPFLVNKSGEIDLPQVGKLKVLGMTKQEAKEAIEKQYAVQYRDPKVEIAILNLSVSVQGEVGSPGVFPLLRERTTLIEVLSAAGGVSQYGKRSVIKVLRGVGQGKEPEILIFDLRQLDAIRTEDMYMRNKDIVYVEPRDIRVLADALQPYTNVLSLFSTISTLAVIVLNIGK